MSQNGPKRSPDDQQHTDWGGFDRLFTFPLQQAVETQHTAALMLRNAMAMQDRFQRQNLELTKAVYNSSLRAYERSMRDLSRTVEVCATAGPAPRAMPKPTSMSDGNRQQPRQSTGNEYRSPQ